MFILRPVLRDLAVSQEGISHKTKRRAVALFGCQEEWGIGRPARPTRLAPGAAHGVFDETVVFLTLDASICAHV